MLENVLEVYPKRLELASGQSCDLRPIEPADEAEFHRLFLAIPQSERSFIKHRVTDRAVIREWCQTIDLGRHLPLLAFLREQVVAAATLHQQLGGWKRHIGRVSVLVHPEFRGRGLARGLLREIIGIAASIGLEKLEAEFLAEQAAAIKVFGLLGFTPLLRLQDYVKDMDAVKHDYLLMGLDLETDEEYAGMG